MNELQINTVGRLMRVCWLAELRERAGRLELTMHFEGGEKCVMRLPAPIATAVDQYARQKGGG